MTSIYSYARQKLNATGFGRDVFLDLLLKRTIKSVSMTGGRNIGKNKWLGLIDALVATDPEKYGGVLSDLEGRLHRYERTHKRGCLRMHFLIDYIRRDRTCGDRLNARQLIEDWFPKFEAQEQSEWILSVARNHNVYKADCGHFTTDTYTLRGTDEDVFAHSTVCHACSQDLINSGVRTFDNNGEMVLSRYAVSAFMHGQSTRTFDRRNSHIMYDERRQIWYVQGWSPYQGLIDSYHSSKNKGFNVIDSQWLRSNRRAFGCELEVEVVSGEPYLAAGRVHDLLNPSGVVGEYCYFERDGSIGTGFELITQPAGLDVHREKLALFLNDNNIKRGMRSHEGGRCGFHVHVGREYVTQSQIYRVQSFLNDVRNEALIRSIARRYSGGYCRIKHEMAKFSPHNKNTGERYEALNVQNAKTIEFRIFRGSLRYESIMAALEFCNAVLAFCTPGVTAIQDFTSIGFKKFVLLRENREDTKFLRSYLALDANHDNERQAA